MTKICPTCKQEFSKPYSESKKAWFNRHVYCSKACQYPPKITKVCLECSTHFTVKNYRKETANFCSQLCAHSNRNYGLTPANEKVRKSAAYKAWRTLVFERDNYTCIMCSIRGGNLHADHIKPFAFYPELRLEPSNGRTLCVECHKKTPTYGVRPLKDCVAVA